MMVDTTVETDCIDRSIVIQASRERVWHVLSNAEEFGAWFGARLTGQHFAPGQRVRGPITISGYEHVWFDVIIEQVVPKELLSYRWHPFAVDASMDYDAEEPTLVTFTLKDAPEGGTLLQVVESGFENVAPDRRLEAFRKNDQGWEWQMNNIAEYAARS